MSTLLINFALSIHKITYEGTSDTSMAGLFGTLHVSHSGQLHLILNRLRQLEAEPQPWNFKFNHL